MTTEQILEVEFESLKTDLIQAYISKGMKASGDFEDSAEVIVLPNSAKLLANHYARQLEDGRKSGGRPPIEAIKQWIIDKGISNNVKKNISITSLAFAIATKIGKQGWKRERHGGVNLISDVVTDKRMQEIINKVGQGLTIALVQRLEEEFRKIAV